MSLDWQHRIADMDPWANGRCVFCGVAQYPTFPQRLSERPHAHNCLWQHAKDATPPASKEPK